MARAVGRMGVALRRGYVVYIVIDLDVWTECLMGRCNDGSTDVAL